jgi:hypothetical protein
MRMRVFYINYHMDGEALENQLNELIDTCERSGDTVIDVEVQVVPIKRAENVHQYHGYRYLVLIKVEGRGEAAD